MGCVFITNANPCDDGKACTGPDGCTGGVCVGALVNCDDGDPCTTDGCSESSGAGAVGCTHAPADLGCDDGNPCTTDTCKPGKGCLFTANANPCDDGKACTGPDGCNSGVCVGALVNCDDGDPCTSDSCVDAVGPNAAGCKNAPADLACDDNNPCTTDTCKPGKGCVFTTRAGTCDDQDACTVGDVCAGIVCLGTPRTCDDDRPCTDDSCSPSQGCTTVSNTALCSDGDVCTLDDACADGACVPGIGRDCDDGDACTVDACGSSGCTHTPSGSAGCFAWLAQVGASPVAPAEGADGTLYFAGRSATDANQAGLTALDGGTGGSLWSAANKCISSSLVLSDDRLLYTTDWNCAGDGYRIAVNAATGGQLWSLGGGCGGPHARGPLALDGKGGFYWGAGSVCRSLVSTGATSWTVAIAGYIGAAGSMALSDGSVIGHGHNGGCGSRGVARVSPSGSAVWSQVNTTEDQSYGAIGPDGTLIEVRSSACAGGPSRMAGVSPATGAVLWSVDTPLGTSLGQPIVDGEGHWFAVAGDVTKAVVRGQAGTIQWQVAAPGARIGFLDDDSALWIVSDGDVVALSSATGAELARHHTGLTALEGVIATVDRRLVVWTASGKVAKLLGVDVGYDSVAAWPKPLHDRANTNRAHTPALCAPCTVQPGPTDGKDHYIGSVYNSDPDGSADYVRTGGWGDSYWGLIQLPLDTLPAVATKAVLRLYAMSGTANPTSFYVDRITSAWAENVTWSARPSTTTYASASAATVGQWTEIEVTTLYNGWKAGTMANYGVQLRSYGTNNNYNAFWTSDYLADPTLRPMLQVWE
jgi:hypothetical protein